MGCLPRYYPYVPIGAIRQGCEQIRYRRSDGYIDPGLFLMLGTAGHHTTRDSFIWFLKEVRKHGLPQGVRIVVAGLGTDELLPAHDPVPGLELKGWLEQEELDRLLARVGAVLIPQILGFGALTRLPELSCAGVPCIVSRHAVHALDPPPGLQIVDDDWGHWYAAFSAVRAVSRPASLTSYHDWEARQERPLLGVVRHLLRLCPSALVEDLSEHKLALKKG